MQFIITAYDHTDSDALNRRLACREAHLEGIKRMIKQGIFLSGGAMLDDQGKMIGSSVHVEFPNREALDSWLTQDPYVSEKVWDRIEICEARLVPVEQFK
ncbi:YciI family protein [Pseudoalteromonas sp. T1lg23B]|uniref:YciI family protein n=1 Tax=Pseudoalteromonas sp. T1lg23B TaxID=2077097 RepID=UPI000CF6B6C8|nr:YciI family protein [Pseudoalteromonas sp. T1lg23B]